MRSITIELKESSLMKLENLAKQAGQNTTDYLAQNLDEYLQYLEDSEDIAIAQKRLADIESGKSKTYSLEEIAKENGIE